MKKSILAAAALLSVIVTVTSCSSAPKRTMERTEVANSAYNRLEVAKTELAHGDYQTSRNDFDLAYKEALSVDNADLLTKVCLSRMSYVIATGDGDAKQLLDEAKSYAERSKDSARLTAMCTLYEARLLLSNGDETSLTQAWVLCEKSEEGLKKDGLYLAYLYRTRGEILFAQKRFEESEKPFEDAASLHIKERYLSEIALDYYYLARAYSAQQKKEAAINALENALKYDRLDENTAGLGADYYALAVVLTSGNPSAQDLVKSREYAIYSAKVYAAGGFDELSVKSLELAR